MVKIINFMIMCFLQQQKKSEKMKPISAEKIIQFKWYEQLLIFHIFTSISKEKLRLSYINIIIPVEVFISNLENCPHLPLMWHSQ